ncbi:hypothetical protein [Methylobacterium iners]|uniref:Uncharacterized protein n=1 Tax=Methylobacterium iners TaxID=418707 RepID=A0ABQ4RUM7_9HYPH|nr:hypothetical protein [Methylobacterium iners]GJD93378.1 hypothetical protein OCOJLMKI_0572 [Methylobacterium iners]
MEKYAELLTQFVAVTGPAGSLIAALIVGLALAVILYARTKGLFQGVEAGESKQNFVDQLIEQVDRLAAREERLQHEADKVERENDRLKDRQRELLTKIELMRNQLRRAIDLLRAVREGRLPPEAIEAADTIELSP